MSAVLDAREPSARYLEAVQPALVRQFELLARAESGVTRLRELILTLAVQGKLVSQYPGEAPASEILAKARAAAAGQRRERKNGASNEAKAVEPDDGSPPLPHGWEWCRGVDLYTVIRGVTYQKADAADSPRHDSLPILRANNIRTKINFDDLVHVPGNLVNEEQLLRPGDFVVCMASGSKNLVGKAAVFTGEKVCSFGAFCGAIRLAVPLPFFSVFLASPLYRDAVSEASSGIGINNLKSSTLLSLAIALPPEAEQARIVARVDELMQLCDALEAKGRLEAQQHARLLETLLGTLTDSTTPEELAANWQRVAEHFDLLLDRPEAVDVLEQTVLQLAVRGLLVPQDPREEPGIVLLEQIQAAKAAGPTNSKNHRVRAELPEVGEHERPFEPPPGWVWTRFGEVTHVSGGVTLGRKGAIAKPLSLPYLRVANVQRWKLALDSLKDVVIDESELPRYQLVNGDLLITEGGDWDKVGRTSIWRGELPICLHQNHVFKARGYIGAWHPGWAELYLNLDIARSYFAASAKQTTNLASINMTELRHCAFPLPPRAEQDRIIARATELRKLCADLRRRLTASQATQSQLAEALIDSATA